MKAQAPYSIELDYRFGPYGITAPTDEQLQNALADIYDKERLEEFDEVKRDVILDTELRCKSNDGTTCRINISEGSWTGGLILCAIENADGDGLGTYQKDNVPYEKVLALWRLLARAEVDQVEDRVKEIPSNPQSPSLSSRFRHFLSQLRRSNP